MHDDCPNDPDKVDPGVCGCGISDEDTDNDGTPDCIDNCPYDPNKTEPGVNGCGNTEPPPAGDSSVSDPEEGQTGIDSIQPDNGMNDNSIPDSDQANFTSLKLNTDQDYVTIESPQGTTLHCQNTSAIATEMLSASEGIQFPSGFFEFTVSGVQSGGSIAVILTLPSGSVVDTYYKYGKTPDNPMDHWYEFLYDGETGAEINENVITLHFVDGKRGDDDLDGTNGMIVDPGGPALLSSAIDRATESAGDETGSGGCFIGSFMN
jgi:hypothetical protein